MLLEDGIDTGWTGILWLPLDVLSPGLSEDCFGGQTLS